MSWTWNIPARFNIAAACLDRHQESEVAARTALIVDDEGEGLSGLSYGELAGRSARFAGVLRELGIEADERVLIRLPNSPAYPVAFFGTLRAGCIAVPTSTLLSAEEIGYLLKDAAPQVAVLHRSDWPAIGGRVLAAPSVKAVLLAGAGPLPQVPGEPRVLDLHAALAESEPAPPADTRADDPAYLVYTSGTTGYPKGVLHAHRSLLGRRPASEHWFDFREGDRILHTGKFNWTYVLGTGLMDPLYRGASVVVREGPNDPAGWIELIARHRCTIFIGVPTIYRQILQKTDAGAADVPTLRHCMCAGEHLSDDVLRRWRERFGVQIHEALGMSECSYYISNPPGRPVRPGSAGLPQPGHVVRLLDEQLHEVPVGEEGMISIRADDPGLFLRYWNQPELTEAAFEGGWFRTGDYARRDAEGYLWFLGRRDDLINSFGYRVSPHEVERVLKGHPGIADAVVVGEMAGPDKVLVSACVIPAPGASPSEQDVVDYARGRLASYKVPRRVHFMDDFPRTRNGKVLRSRVRALLEASTEAFRA